MRIMNKGTIIAILLVLSSVILSTGIMFIVLRYRDNPAKVTRSHDCVIPEKYAAMVHKINEETKIPEKIVFNWINEESTGWKAGTGAHGEKGLTQVLPSNFDSFEKMYYTGKDQFDPARDDCSLEIGMKHLADCYADTHDWFLALCQYNVGRTAIRNQYIPPSTIAYAIHIWTMVNKD